MKIQIKNGHVIDPKNNIDSQLDVFIAAGKIVALGKAPEGFIASQTIDASNLIVCPGLVDLSARLREPGDEYKATLISELQAAVAGGVTSLACPPDTDPVLDEPGLVEMLKHRAKQLNLAHVYPLGALTRQLQGKVLSEMGELREAGCVGFSQANIAITDTQVLWRAMEYAATFGFTLFLHAEEPFLAKDGVAHDGEVASRLGLKGIPSAAEALALASILRIAKETGARIHISRLSTAEGVDMIREAKKHGVNITCDVSANHLHLTEHDIGFFDANCHLKPPLRTQRDKDALGAGLKDGTIDAICSDHTPVDDDAKLAPFAEAEVGATGLELLLALTLKWANQEKTSLAKAIALISQSSAKILGIAAGDLSVNANADICIFDANEYWKIVPSALKSQGKNTPFNGLEIAGKVKTTLINGQVVYQSE
ncbi:dihydroorotase [Methylotenera versatilis]|uniref:Dihydroorotase, multifunctional complex type n=1 Tax=Methylotenera versatilis (strain 301) TaxID=666681 RepID=D7DNL7_METV0|nr:dihydroorotase [Methylotenera versatilis]ADI29034.1 dihydroorotase, multifunctional complex type [Methylotenera versatilis 301]